jgi:hypothetical protein
MQVNTYKGYSRFLGMALLFGAINLGMYVFTPHEYLSKVRKFETELPILLSMAIVVGFGIVPAFGFLKVLEKYGRENHNRAYYVPLFLKGLLPGLIGSTVLVIFCFLGLGRSGHGALSALGFLILVVVLPSMIIGGIARIVLPESRLVPFLVPVMIILGGMSGYISLMVFLRLASG